MGFQRTIPHQIDVSRSKYVYMRAVRRSYGHNKHKNAIWRAQDAVKREHEGSDRGDDFFFWPLDQRLLNFKLKLKMVLDDILYIHICFKSSQVLSAFWRALNSSIHVRYKGYSVAYYYSTRNRTVEWGYLKSNFVLIFKFHSPYKTFKCIG